MRAVLAIDGDDAGFHAGFGALLADITGEHGRGYTLRAANGFFGADDFAFAPEFVDLLSGTYAAAVEPVPFGSDTPPASTSSKAPPSPTPTTTARSPSPA
jgi:hypothetical protein